MADECKHKQGEPADDFAAQAAEAPPSVVREFWEFLRDNKKWWLTPIVFVLLLVSVLVILGSTTAAPLIYTLF